MIIIPIKVIRFIFQIAGNGFNKRWAAFSVVL
jgi:hypothetical protein